MKIFKKTLLFTLLILFYSCQTVESNPEEEIQEEAPVEIVITENTERNPENFRFSGTSSFTIRPGTVRTITITANTEQEINDDMYVWHVVDDSIVSIRGIGARCTVMGRKEGRTQIIVTNMRFALPYVYEVHCTFDEQTRRIERTLPNENQNRLTDGHSGINIRE